MKYSAFVIFALFGVLLKISVFSSVVKNEILTHKHIDIPIECKEAFKVNPLLQIERAPSFHDITTANIKTGIVCSQKLYNLNINSKYLNFLNDKERFEALVTAPIQVCQTILMAMQLIRSSDELHQIRVNILESELSISEHHESLYYEYEKNIYLSRKELSLKLDKTIYFDEFEEILLNSNDRSLRKKVFERYKLLGCSKQHNNSEVIDRIVDEFTSIASENNFEDYVQMQMEYSMAGDTSEVLSFLERNHSKIASKMQKEMELIINYGKEIHHIEEVKEWDWMYLMQQYKNEKVEDIDYYFPKEHVFQQIFIFIQEMFELRIVKSDIKQHDEVRVYDVIDKTTNIYFGSIYIDEFAKPDVKESQPFTSLLRHPVPVLKIKPLVLISLTHSKNQPTLSLDDIRNIFHEMGHCFQMMLSGLDKFHHLTDTIEFVSMFMERFANNSDVILGLSSNKMTAKDLTLNELNDYIKIHSTFTGINLMRKMYESLVDYYLYSYPQRSWRQIIAYVRQTYQISDIIYDRTCNRRVLFSHLYAGSTYGYLWSEIMALEAYSFLYSVPYAYTKKALKFRQLFFEMSSESNNLKALRRYTKDKDKSHGLKMQYFENYYGL